jgi:phosphoribosyl-ATP pyrophosphohydrolase/phosphoribosyl-AMP cyclohydrolase
MQFSRSVLDQLRYDASGLIPAVVQEFDTGKVLMVAYMNRESLGKTLETGQTWFYSRSRQQLWWKGATSGHYQEVIAIEADCDYDTLLIQVEQVGGIACHEGQKSCFHNPLTGGDEGEALVGAVPSTGLHHSPGHQPRGAEGPGLPANAGLLHELESVILARKAVPDPESYTAKLMLAGIDRICRKVGEETAEVIVAAKNESPAELTYEAGDLIYHLLVLLAAEDVSLDAVLDELARRRSGHGGRR